MCSALTHRQLFVHRKCVKLNNCSTFSLWLFDINMSPTVKAIHKQNAHKCENVGARLAFFSTTTQTFRQVFEYGLVGPIEGNENKMWDQ